MRIVRSTSAEIRGIGNEPTTVATMSEERRTPHLPLSSVQISRRLEGRGENGSVKPGVGGSGRWRGVKYVAVSCLVMR